MTPARPPGFSDIRKAAALAATQALRRGENPARAVMDAADAFFQAVRGPLNLEPMIARIACSAGCSWCCHQIVGVTQAELALLGDAIKAMPAERQAVIKSRAEAAMAKGSGLDQAGWWKAKIRCPLLEDDGLCGVHAHRPLPCRGYNSADADLCRRSYEGEAVKAPVLAAQHGIWGHAQGGLAEALAQAGLASGLAVLAEGVQALTSKP